MAAEGNKGAAPLVFFLKLSCCKLYIIHALVESKDDKRGDKERINRFTFDFSAMASRQVVFHALRSITTILPIPYFYSCELTDKDR